MNHDRTRAHARLSDMHSNATASLAYDLEYLSPTTDHLGHTPHVLPDVCDHLTQAIWDLPAKRRPPTAAPARGVVAPLFARRLWKIYWPRAFFSASLDMSHLSLMVCWTILDWVRSAMVPPFLT